MEKNKNILFSVNRTLYAASGLTHLSYRECME